MRIYLDSSPVLPFIKEKIVSLLSQKIILAVAFAFGCLGLLFFYNKRKVLLKTVTTQKSNVPPVSKTSPVSTTEVRKNSWGLKFSIPTVNGKMEGKGKCVHEREVNDKLIEQTYDVEFKNDRIIRLESRDLGVCFEGDFDLDLSGKGKFKSQNKFAEGEFEKSELKNGTLTFLDPSSKIASEKGNFDSDELINGERTLRTGEIIKVINGVFYEHRISNIGSFNVPIVNGKMEGKGQYILNSSAKAGDVVFKNNQIIKITFNNGTYSEGNFDLDLVGKGKFVSSHLIFEGDFKKDDISEGTITYLDSSKDEASKKGVFKKGQLIDGEIFLRNNEVITVVKGVPYISIKNGKGLFIVPLVNGKMEGKGKGYINDINNGEECEIDFKNDRIVGIKARDFTAECLLDIDLIGEIECKTLELHFKGSWNKNDIRTGKLTYLDPRYILNYEEGSFNKYVLIDGVCNMRNGEERKVVNGQKF